MVDRKERQREQVILPEWLRKYDISVGPYDQPRHKPDTGREQTLPQKPQSSGKSDQE